MVSTFGPVLEAGTGSSSSSEVFDGSRILASAGLDLLDFFQNSLMRSKAFSPIMIEGALVLPPTTRGMIEASATRSPDMP